MIWVWIVVGIFLFVCWVAYLGSLQGEAERKLGRPLTLVETVLGAQHPLIAMLLLNQLKEPDDNSKDSPLEPERRADERAG